MHDPDRLRAALSSIRLERVYVQPEELPPSLLAALTAFDPARPSAAWEALMARGSVYVNGKRAFSDCPLPLPCRIELFDPAPNAPPPIAAFLPEWLLFQNDDFCVVFKPAGISTSPAREQRFDNLKALVEGYLGRTVHVPSRLDTSTQGLVPLSLSTRMNRTLQRAFEKRVVKKHYLVGVQPAPDWETHTLSAAIGRHPEHPVLRAVTPDGQTAETHFVVRQRRSDSALVSAFPKTGRTHQIRVHCQYLGMPVIGDDFYGGQVSDSLQLIAYELTFPVPYSSTPFEIKVPERLLPRWCQTTTQTMEANAGSQQLMPQN